MSIVRKSKFRHVYGGVAKREAQYFDLKVTQQSLESNMLKVNNKYIAYIFESSGGCVRVFPLSETGKHPVDVPLIKGHLGKVTDLDFCPHNPDYLLTSCEDTLIRLWEIPQDGLPREGLQTPIAQLRGHGRKPVELWWNPAVSNVVGSSSADSVIKVWDIKKEKAVFSIDKAHNDAIQSFQWNIIGSQIATQSRDKKVRVFDVRSSKKVLEVASHQGVKGAKVLWSNEKNWVISCGFGKQIDRQILVWDVRNPSSTLISHVIDQSSSQLIPFFDEGTQLLYVCSKGESSIRYYEINNDKPFCHFIANFQEGVPAKGVAQFPKPFINTKTCEVTRLYKITSKNTIEAVSFTVPRRAEIFQEDLYPPVPDPTAPAMTSDEWLSGKNTPQQLFYFTAEGSIPFASPNPAASPAPSSHYPLPAHVSPIPGPNPRKPISKPVPVVAQQNEVVSPPTVVVNNTTKLNQASARQAELELALKLKDQEIETLQNKITEWEARKAAASAAKAAAEAETSTSVTEGILVPNEGERLDLEPNPSPLGEEPAQTNE